MAQLEIELDADGGLDAECLDTTDGASAADTTGVYNCLICSKTLTNRRSFQQHERWHSLPFHCQQCGRRFATRYNVRCHERQHSGIKPYLCPECGQTFRLPGALSLHSRSHTDTRPYQCTYCDATFRRNGNLREHVLFKHEPHKLFACEQCDRQFITALKLDEHSHVHSGVRPYCCNLCDKTFHSRLHLSSHRRRLHPDLTQSTDQRQCPECNCILSCRESLVVHMRRHTGQFAFSCTECDKHFVSSSELAFHRQTHSTEKPFVCDICQKHFKRKKTMTQHRQTHCSEMKHVSCRRDNTVSRSQMQHQCDRSQTGTVDGAVGSTAGTAAGTTAADTYVSVSVGLVEPIVVLTEVVVESTDYDVVTQLTQQPVHKKRRYYPPVRRSVTSLSN